MRPLPERVSSEPTTLPRTLIVSPHLDDAMLSTAGLLLEDSAGTEVLTVFSGLPAGPVVTPPSHWDLECGFATAAESMAARRAEDDQAFAGLAVRRHHLDLADGGYGERAAPAGPLIADWVRRWVDEQTGPVRVLVPVGAGVSRSSRESSRTAPTGDAGRSRARALAASVLGRPGRAVAHRLFLRRKRRVQAQGLMLTHLDHLLVRDAVVEELAGRESCTLLCYEELPYLWSAAGDAAAAAVASRFATDAVLESTSVDVGAKAARVAAYRSQVAALDPAGRLVDPASLPTSERRWRLVPRHDASGR